MLKWNEEDLYAMENEKDLYQNFTWQGIIYVIILVENCAGIIIV